MYNRVDRLILDTVIRQKLCLYTLNQNVCVLNVLNMWHCHGTDKHK